VFESYELHEQATGALTPRTAAGVVHIGLRGHGIATMRPGTWRYPTRRGQALSLKRYESDTPYAGS